MFLKRPGSDRYRFSWSIAVKHNWETMKTAVNNYIGSLNWGYRVQLREKSVNYVNSFAEFVEPHKIKVSRYLAFIHRVCMSGQ